MQYQITLDYAIWNLLTRKEFISKSTYERQTMYGQYHPFLTDRMILLINYKAEKDYG